MNTIRKRYSLPAYCGSMSKNKDISLFAAVSLQGDLGAIDEKYDVAISTTCRALDYIVVDNVDTAQMCVEFLRRENLGIASFLVLDKQEKLRPYMAKPPSTYVAFHILHITRVCFIMF